MNNKNFKLYSYTKDGKKYIIYALNKVDAKNRMLQKFDIYPLEEELDIIKKPIIIEINH